MSNKFQLLMWKNFLLQYHHPIQTLLDVLLPVLFCGILIVLRMNIKTDVVKTNTIYPSYAPDSFMLPLVFLSFFILLIRFICNSTDQIRYFVQYGRVKQEERPYVAERRIVFYPANPILKNFTGKVALGSVFKERMLSIHPKL